MSAKSQIKKISKSILPEFIIMRARKQLDKRQFNSWEKNNCPVPPPHIVKQYTIAEYQQKYGFTTLVETGTYLGEMVEAQKSKFKKIISIELSSDLYKKAVRRFKNDANVVIVQGDSGKVLPEILPKLDESAIFWLDGHYSAGITAKGEKECPIFEELNAILSSNKLDHTLLIDDARLFIGKGDYPTIASLTEFIQNRNGKYQVEVKHDIIRYSV